MSLLSRFMGWDKNPNKGILTTIGNIISLVQVAKSFPTSTNQLFNKLSSVVLSTEVPDSIPAEHESAVKTAVVQNIATALGVKP